MPSRDCVWPTDSVASKAERGTFLPSIMPICCVNTSCPGAVCPLFAQRLALAFSPAPTLPVVRVAKIWRWLCTQVAEWLTR